MSTTEEADPWSDLEECLGPRCPHLKHDGQDGEDDDLDSGAPCVPVGSTDPVLRRGRLSSENRQTQVTLLATVEDCSRVADQVH